MPSAATPLALALAGAGLDCAGCCWCCGVMYDLAIAGAPLVKLKPEWFDEGARCGEGCAA